MCRQVRITYQALKALRHVEELVNHIFFNSFQTTEHNSSILHFAETLRPTDRFPRTPFSVQAVRTSSAGERWAVFCIGVPRILFLFERGANYNHDIWAVLSP